MVMFQDTSPVELICGHEICARCILRESNNDDSEINCQKCNQS